MDMRELKGLEIAARSRIGFKDGAGWSFRRPARERTA